MAQYHGTKICIVELWQCFYDMNMITSLKVNQKTLFCAFFFCFDAKRALIFGFLYFKLNFTDLFNFYSFSRLSKILHVVISVSFMYKC